MTSFEKRIYFGLVVVIVSFAPFILGAFVALEEMASQQKTLISKNAQQMLLAERLRYMDSTQSALMPVYVLSGHEDLLKSFDRRNIEFDEISSQLRQLEDQDQVRNLIDRIQEMTQELYAKTLPGIQMKRARAPIEKVNDYFRANVGKLNIERHRMLNELITAESDQFQQAKGRVETTVNRVLQALVVLSLLALVLVALILRLFVKVMRQKKSFDQAQIKLLEQERRLSLARKEAVEVVAHDLKSPLGTIAMSVDLMLDQIALGAEPHELENCLHIAQRSADSMEKLIKDLLDHAKIEAGHLILDRKETDIASTLKMLVQRFQNHAQTKNIFLTADLVDEKIFINCDASRMEQALANLIGNAIKFTPEFGQVTVSAQASVNEVLFSVEDNGVGLDSEQLPHIFDRFWQVRQTAKQGTGLGLAITKAIVEGHHGKIWVDSQVGKGSRFNVLLPNA